MPVTRLKTVVLPAPLGPIMPKIVLGSMLTSTSLTAIRPPKVLVNPEILSKGIDCFLSRRRSHFRTRHNRFLSRDLQRDPPAGPKAGGAKDHRQADKAVTPVPHKAEDFRQNDHAEGADEDAGD